MKEIRPILIFLLTMTALETFSQLESYSNRRYPFQVLFCSDARANGNQIKQFDFLKKDMLLTSFSELVLIHYTGEVIVVKDTIFDLSRTSKFYRNKKVYTRPILDPEMSYLRRQFGSICHFPEVIEIIYPNEFDIIEHPSAMPLAIEWRFNQGLDDTTNYNILIQNIFDDPIDTLSSTSKFVEIDVSNYELEDGLLILTVYLEQKPDIRSRSFGVRIFDSADDEKMKYKLVLNALENDNKMQPLLANHFYKSSIIESNQDPRFIQLYEDFLERNPELK